MEKQKLILLVFIVIITMCVIAQEKEEQFLIKTDYLVSLPTRYKDDPDKQWPVLIFLHGSRESPSLEKVKNDFLPIQFSKDKNTPLILVSPSNSFSRWSVDILNQMLDDVKEKYHVDKNRIYLSGHSLGGWGTWNWALENPEIFAAIAPISGCFQGGIKTPWKLRHIPIWIFHGEKDENTNANCNSDTMKHINKYGGKAKITLYPEAGHDIWELPFAKNNLMRWLLQQNKVKNILKTPPLNSGSYEKYSGRYILESNAKDTIEVVFKADKLHVVLENKNVIPLSFEEKTSFYVDPAPWAGVEFVIDKKRVIGLNLLAHKHMAYTKLNK